MIAVEQVYRRAHQWFRRATDDPRCRVGAWLCMTARGEPAGALPDLALPPAGCRDEPRTDQPMDLVRADPARLLRLADQITDQTMFGRTTDQVPADLLASWTIALPVAVALAVRAHDLVVTSALLRAGAYLRRDGKHPQLRDATAFLAAQQQPDGGFGALPVGADPALQHTVRVPLTLGCVWALAETMAKHTPTEGDGWRGLTIARPLLAAATHGSPLGGRAPGRGTDAGSH